MRKQVKIQRAGFWQSFTISVNSVFKNNGNFCSILEEALGSLSLAQTVEGFFYLFAFESSAYYPGILLSLESEDLCSSGHNRKKCIIDLVKLFNITKEAVFLGGEKNPPISGQKTVAKYDPS